MFFLKIDGLNENKGILNSNTSLPMKLITVLPSALQEIEIET